MAYFQNCIYETDMIYAKNLLISHFLDVFQKFQPYWNVLQGLTLQKMYPIAIPHIIKVVYRD